MTKQISISLLFVFAIVAHLFAQTNDPVLFTVKGNPVKVSEFKYIYDKTNGEEANYSKASLEEYLDLYTKFKLKVQKAKDMQLDTIPTLKKELEGYRQTLADSYLLDREVIDKLVEEAYERQKYDVDISHIMISIPQNIKPADTLGFYKNIENVQKQLKNGKSFAELAKKYSTDGSSKNDGGRVGFITAILPNGFYPLETTAYTLKKGETSGIIRTGVGYHIVKVNDRRPARGEMEVAHILVRKNKTSKQEDLLTKANDIYERLQAGGNFDELARTASDDKLTASKAGYLGFFGVNRYEDSFEDAAFALANDGDISKPIETKAGFHIIKRISKRGIQPFKDVKGRLEQKVRKDGRFQLATTSMVERIKKESNFSETTIALNDFKETLDADFLTFKWRSPEEKPKTTLFSLGENYKVNIGDFMDYAQKAARQRINLGRTEKDVNKVVDALYQEFVVERVLKFEESQLEEKYPDFKALMREYQEGILLFEATKMLVWDKASQDTTGLKTFFKTIDGKYKWEDRANVVTYTISGAGLGKVEEIRKFAAANDVKTTLLEFNKEGNSILSAEEKTFEKGRNEVIDALEWTSGSISDNRADKNSRTLSFDKIERIIPPTSKSLKEARGYVVADYQDYLEKEWVKKLRKEYDVKLNKRVLNKMVKK